MEGRWTDGSWVDRVREPERRAWRVQFRQGMSQLLPQSPRETWESESVDASKDRRKNSVQYRVAFIFLAGHHLWSSFSVFREIWRCESHFPNLNSSSQFLLHLVHGYVTWLCQLEAYNIFKKICLFIWLNWVLVVASRIFTVAHRPSSSILQAQ